MEMYERVEVYLHNILDFGNFMFWLLCTEESEPGNHWRRGELLLLPLLETEPQFVDHLVHCLVATMSSSPLTISALYRFNGVTTLSEVFQLLQQQQQKQTTKMKVATAAENSNKNKH
jgi:hypothetical protein